MSVLVTGAGLIGSQISRLLVEEGERPVLLDVAPQLHALADIVGLEQLTVVQGDILSPLDLARVIREHRISRIVHTAANPLLTAGAQRNPYAAIRVNILGTVHVLEAARAHGLGRVVLTSSAVLSHYLSGGEDGGNAAKEEAFPRPSTFYAATKQAVESLGLNYARWFNLDVVVVRFSAVVGPWRGRGGGGPSNTFRDLIERSLQGEETALPRRAMEWVYAKDAAAGALLALKASGLQSRVFNISTGQVYKAEEVAETVRRVIPTARIRLEEVKEEGSPFPEVHDPLDLTRSRSQLGYAPRYDLEGAIRDYVAWYQRLG